jgi:2-polyprenyl-3-methyl-5-hydroxy-6-metoxy-1,4-benzoquinol methylase
MMPRRHELISDNYLAEQRALHLLPQGYGGKGSRWADTVAWIATRHECGSVLDYGCGMGTLAKALIELAPRLSVREYDPAVDGKDGRPAFADLVVCTDVLEHIEPDKIGNVLTHIGTLARKAMFFVVCLRPSNKLLSDGITNAHLLVRSKAWWEAKVDEQHWEIVDGADLPVPAKVDREKHWIAVVRPC